MNRSVLIAQLAAARAAIDAALLLLAEPAAAQPPQPPSEPEPGCRHTERDTVSGFGGPLRAVCRGCGLNFIDGKEVQGGE